MSFKDKETAATYARNYYHSNKHKQTEEQLEKKRDYVRQWRKNNPERAILAAAKARAKRLGYDFNIELSDIVIPMKCPILDIPLRKTMNEQNDNSFALDRVDNSKGYIKGNVQVISHKANRHKADLSLQDIKRLYEYSHSSAKA